MRFARSRNIPLQLIHSCGVSSLRVFAGWQWPVSKIFSGFEIEFQFMTFPAGGFYGCCKRIVFPPEMRKMKSDNMRIALAGNPNCGKTTVFNGYTGSRQHVGNYPGVTVDRKEGELTFEGQSIILVDLPGTYSLTAYSAGGTCCQKRIGSFKYSVSDRYSWSVSSWKKSFAYRADAWNGHSACFGLQYDGWSQVSRY